ncbi:MAG: alanine--glyoxylate aminotransferase family protein [Thermoanaerobaculia bacterium]|nr:alanine--glyoxylate aminotransferase family protein [Thermoanaerobaculia bacterium]
MTEDIRFFLPGPTYVREDVRAAMTQHPIGHRGAPFKALYADVRSRLPGVFRTSGEVVLLTSSGSLAWDVAVASTIESSVLCCTNGAFSDRFLTVCRAWGKDADQLDFPHGAPVDPDLIRQALRRKPYEAVTLAHNETSTGTLSDLASIARTVREESDAMIYVDAVSSLAGCELETETWGIDYLFTGSQKALALPPGLCFVTVSERALAKAREIEHRGYYTDLVRYYEKHVAGGTITTPAIPQIWALQAQLNAIESETMEKRWQRHSELRAKTEAWAERQGFTYLNQPDGASPTVSCLRPPTGVEAPALVAALAERGIVVGGGYGPLKPKTFRIGHMGEVRARDLDALFAAIEEVVVELRS